MELFPALNKWPFASSFISFTFLALAALHRIATCTFCDPSNCGHLHNVDYPFGTQAGCGLPDFLLNCSTNPPQWKPLNASQPLASVVDMPVSTRTSGSVLLTQDSMSTSCSFKTIPSKELRASLPLQGVRFGANKTVFLLFECDASIEILEPFHNFEYSSSHCAQLYKYCRPWTDTAGAQSVPCFESSDVNANFTYLVEEYNCTSYTALYDVETNSQLSSSLSSHFGMELNWELSSPHDNCTACVASHGSCGYNPEDLSFRCYCKDNRFSNRDCSDKAVSTVNRHCTGHLCSAASKAGTAVGLGGFLILATFLVFCFRKRKHAVKRSQAYVRHRSSQKVLQVLAGEAGPLPAKLFTYAELSNATNSFAECRMLGDGGFGSVYEGRLYDGRKVAVKRLYRDNNRKLEQFVNEIMILSGAKHPNLVELYGFCNEQDGADLLLVYEYVSNGTLADHLHGDGGKGLPWETRLKMAIETAQALNYLHCCVNPPIFHRDVKSSNILLDENFHVKVADFGLSRFVPLNHTHVSTAPQGTPGYVDPDYYQSYQLTAKSDVYSFGVVLMEIISAKLPVDTSRSRGEVNLSNLAISKIQSGALDELVDPNLEISKCPVIREMVTRVAEVGFRCLCEEREDRPTMYEVCVELDKIKQLGYSDSGGVGGDRDNSDNETKVRSTSASSDSGSSGSCRLFSWSDESSNSV